MAKDIQVQVIIMQPRMTKIMNTENGRMSKYTETFEGEKISW